MVDGLDEASEEARWFIENDLPDIDPEKLSIFTTSRPDKPKDLGMFCNACHRECIRYVSTVELATALSFRSDG